MRLIKTNRKGTEYAPAFLVLAVLILLIYSSMTLYYKVKDFPPIGDTQYKLLNTYDNAQKVQFYIDEAAKQASYKALNDLADNGGDYERECGRYFGYTLLTNQTKNCIQMIDANQNFKTSFDIVFTDYLQRYNLFKIPYGNYEYEATQYELLNIQGVSEEVMSIPIPREIKRGDEANLVPYQTPYVVPKDSTEKIKSIIDAYGEKIRYECKKPEHPMDESLVVGIIAQESGGNPYAVSGTGCSGLTQFCYKTAQQYSKIFGPINTCKCNCGVTCDIQKLQACSCDVTDGRFNADKSVEAAVTYLYSLKNQFRKYTSATSFAIASYNGGSGLISKAISATGKSDPSWEEVSSKLTPELLEANGYRDGKYWNYESRKRKIVEINSYVKYVTGYMVKYEEMESSIGTDSSLPPPPKEEKTHDCCICNPQCGDVCSIQSIPEAQSCGTYSGGKGFNCDMNYCTPKETEIIAIGEYSFTPAFEVDIDYDLEVYDEIYEAIQKMNQEYDISLDKRGFAENIVKHAQEIEPALSWSTDCEDLEEKTFHSFAEQYSLCSESPDDSCYCRINISNDFKEITFSINERNGNTSFRYGTEENTIRNIKPGQISFPPSSPNPFGSLDVTLKKDGASNYILSIHNQNLGKLITNDYPSQPIEKPFLMFKKDGAVSFIDPSVISGFSNYDKAVQDYDLIAKETNTYSECKTIKNTVKLCVSTGKKIQRYNIKTETVENKESVIRFAYTFRDIIPPPLVEEILSFKRPLTEKEAIISWDFDNPNDDTSKFVVFASTDDISMKGFEELEALSSSLDTGVIKKEYSAANLKSLKSIDLKENYIAVPDKTLSFKFKATMSDDTTLPEGFLPSEHLLYNIEDSNKYFVRMAFPSNDDYYIIIAAVDTNDNKQIFDKNEGENRNSFVAVKDSLPPATYPLEGFEFTITPLASQKKVTLTWTTPLKNVDGSEFDASKELSGYNIYYGEDMDKDKFLAASPISTASDVHTKDIPITDFTRNWCFYVVPKDTAQNTQFSDENVKNLMSNPKFYSPRCTLHPLAP